MGGWTSRRVETQNNQLEIRSKKRKLEKALRKGVRSYRNHYLQFKTPKTWEFLMDISSNFDPTFGHRLPVGFTNGMYLLTI